eukprot:gene14565-16720_t
MDDLLNIYIAKHVPDMANFRPKFIPLNPTYVRDKDALATLSPMLDQAGEIGYLSERTRLDIAFAASMLRCEA